MTKDRRDDSAAERMLLATNGRPSGQEHVTMWSATDWALVGVAMLVFLTAVVGAIAWLVHGMSTAPARRPQRHGPAGRRGTPGGTGSSRNGSPS